MKHNVKVGIAHPRLGRGGSEARVMWGIEALKKDYDISLITASNVDLDKLNRFYGTSVRSNEVRIHQSPIFPFLHKLSWGDALRGTLYQRFCRNISNNFDVLISAYNLCDFGVPAIHCLADFSWDEQIRVNSDPIPAGPRSIFHRNSLFRKAYLSLVKVLSRPSGRDLFAGEDLILANSKWTSGIMKEKYGADVEVLYPPVFTEFPKIPHKEKELGFVCIGRISPEKRIERIIEILAAVRRRGHSIHLHVIGGIDGTAYGKKILMLCHRHRDWIELEGSKFGEDKTKLLSQHHFGIHARPGEAFGIAIAEMVKAGCIVFAPKEGGQAEIINHPSLLYGSFGEAVEKIEAVLCNPEVQGDLRNHLLKQGENFSTMKFMDGFRGAVKKFLEEKSTLRKVA